MSNQKGFSSLIFLAIVVLLSSGIIAGSLVIKKNLLQDFKEPSNPVPQETFIASVSPSPSPQVPTASPIIQSEAAENNLDLTKIYRKIVKENRLKECHYYDNCYQDIFTTNAKLIVARKYGVTTDRYPIY